MNWKNLWVWNRIICFVRENLMVNVLLHVHFTRCIRCLLSSRLISMILGALLTLLCLRLTFGIHSFFLVSRLLLCLNNRSSCCKLLGLELLLLLKLQGLLLLLKDQLLVLQLKLELLLVLLLKLLLQN